MSENQNNPFSSDTPDNSASDLNSDTQHTTGGSYSANSAQNSAEGFGSSSTENPAPSEQGFSSSQGAYGQQQDAYSGQSPYSSQASTSPYSSYNSQPNGQPTAGQYGASAYGAQNTGGQYGNQNPYGNQYNGTQAPAKKQKNVLGIVSIALSALGLILGCVPAIMFLGWILLFAGFVTGIVGLFQKFKEKVTPIIGIALSVLGSIIAGIVFFFVVAGAVADATSSSYEEVESTPYASESSYSSPSVAATEEPTVPEGVLAFGKTAEYNDGLKVTISEPADFTPSDTSASIGDDSVQNHRKFTITIENGTKEAYDPTSVYLSGNSGGKEMSKVFDSEQNISSGPEGKILPGDKVSYDAVFGVADPENITLEVSPDYDRESVIFTNKK